MTYQWVTADSNKETRSLHLRLYSAHFERDPWPKCNPLFLASAGQSGPESGDRKLQHEFRFSRRICRLRHCGPAAEPSGQFLKKAFQIRAALDVGSRVWSFSLPLTR
jgi:hypothetical protein